MIKVTIATFNGENLFRRFKFNSKAKPERISHAVENGFIFDKALFEIISDKEKAYTAKAILDCKADIVGLVEVENLETLKNFVSTHFKSKGYKYNVLIPPLLVPARRRRVPNSLVLTFESKQIVYSNFFVTISNTFSGEDISIFYILLNVFLKSKLNVKV